MLYFKLDFCDKEVDFLWITKHLLSFYFPM